VGQQQPHGAPSISKMAAAGQTLPPIAKVVVAIHGIGSQTRSDTIRSVAHRFGDRSPVPLPVMPLGYFHIGNIGQVLASRLDTPPHSPLATIGFAEVFWADIPRGIVKKEDTLEETKAWGKSVVSRAHATYLLTVKKFVDDRQPIPEIYIVAHSEGTVVSFLGLLQALSGLVVKDPDDQSKTAGTGWIDHVRGFMTLGSPIDKHFLLWPKLWENLKLESTGDANSGAVTFPGNGQARLTLNQPIQWREGSDAKPYPLMGLWGPSSKNAKET